MTTCGEGDRKGRLDKNFRHALTLTIEKFLHSIKFSNFSKKYPEIYEKAPFQLEQIYCQLQTELKSQIKENTSELCEKQNVSYLLDSFEKSQLSTSNEILWISYNSTEEDIKNNQFIEKIKQRDRLKSFLQEMRSENDNRENILFKNHEEILTMGKQIKSLNENVTKLLDDLKDSSNPQSKEFLHDVNNLDDYDASSANDFTSSSNSSLTLGVQPELITLDD